jgi:hypothetical protein
VVGTFIFFVLFTLSSLLSPLSIIRADAAVPPFPPFSVEGNPDAEYYFGPIFELFRFVRQPYLKIFENMDRDRTYEDLWVCPGPEHDRRDKVCDDQGDGCDGGDVDLCERDTSSVVRTAYSAHGTCNLDPPDPDNPDAPIKGHCEYTQRPKIVHDISGTDFSAEPVILPFPKIQNQSNAYNYNNQFGDNSDNSITWGSQFLGSDQCEISFRQLLVVRRAKQTKSTVNETGEWPLGWVDWGYKDSNMNKTLLEINDSIPDKISGQMLNILEGTDDFYLNAGNLQAVTDISASKKIVCDEIAKAQSQNPKPQWLIDLGTAPLHSPSFRQGYVRPSICVWDICCPNGRCKVEPVGTRKALYYDISISQEFGAAIDDLFLNYPLDEGIRLFKKIAANNQLVRFATSASTNAIPSVITARLKQELAGTCADYIPWSDWKSFGTHIDYLENGEMLGPNNTCPGYRIMPELTKEKGGSYPESLLSYILNFFWGSVVDSVDSVVYHLITIPDAMGQSIADIKQPVYESLDALADLEDIQEYNDGLSNNVYDGADNLFAGKPSDPQHSKRFLPRFSCNDEMFSDQIKTSIEGYALGTRIGCQGEGAPSGTCDGKLFAELLQNSNYQESSPKGQEYFTSTIQPTLTAELMSTYAAAEEETGVPCEILAGIYFVEADNNPNGSLVSGREIGTPEPDAGGQVFSTLLETAIYAGEHLKGKVGGSLTSAQIAITALSRYNGGGNSNCQAGYPYPIPYEGCPRLFEGEDDPYPTSFLDPKHDTMYLLYCADYTACEPQVFERPGSFTVALNVYNSMTKSGYDEESLPSPTPKPKPGASGKPGSSVTTGFFPKSCGTESLSTALGCLPYTRDSFTSTILSFIVGIAGAIALVIMLIATIQIMTAGGNPEQLKKGKELFTSAIIGLLFLIFSVTLLRLIAGDIIKLPGFTR